MRKLNKIVAFSLLVKTITFADTTSVNGNVSGIWTTDGSPYLVTNNLILQPADTLIINPGVEVRFDGAFRFDIFGTFLAVGTENDSILFTKNGDITKYFSISTPNKKTILWNGINKIAHIEIQIWSLPADI